MRLASASSSLVTADIISLNVYATLFNLFSENFYLRYRCYGLLRTPLSRLVLESLVDSYLDRHR